MAEILKFWHLVWPALGEGLLVTLRLSAGALAIGLLIGLPTALARVFGPRWLQLIATAYVDAFRGTPMLVQLFFIYYGLADPHINAWLVALGLPDGLLVLPSITAAYVALGLNSGAYQAEYFRGALQAVGSGQMLAARALGMTHTQAIVNIVLPQALRLALAPWSNEAAYMVKYTSIVSLIAVPDLFGQARRIMSRHYNQMTMLPFVGLIYLVLVLLITWIMHRIEVHTRIPGLEVEHGRS
ncbi:MAG TPA: amino acid ABC transporter permease [Chloroflexi bacterium]|nr:amino acid ABC transporter permease [Chloroflexota bacterium]